MILTEFPWVFFSVCRYDHRCVCCRRHEVAGETAPTRSHKGSVRRGPVVEESQLPKRFGLASYTHIAHSHQSGLFPAHSRHLYFLGDDDRSHKAFPRKVGARIFVQRLTTCYHVLLCAPLKRFYKLMEMFCQETVFRFV